MIDDLAPEFVRSLDDGTTFQFRCHPGVQCFTDCCRELELALTPYDVLRLKQSLDLTARQFIDQYCLVEQTEESPFPQVYLGMIDDGKASCPFVSNQGCRVYENRPSPCRTYPLGRAAFQTPDGEHHDFHVLLTEPHCKGFGPDNIEQNVEQWNDDQGLNDYNAFNDAVLKVLYHEQAKDRRFSKEELDLFMLALYFLEEFQQDLKKSLFSCPGLPKNDEIDNIDDTDLLQAGIKLLCHEFFNE